MTRLPILLRVSLVTVGMVLIVALITIGLVAAAPLGTLDKALLGALLMLAFLFNVGALAVLVVAARRLDDHVMDEKVQQFSLLTLATALFAVIGANNVVPFLQVGVGLVFLVLGVLVLGVIPLTFLWRFLRLQ